MIKPIFLVYAIPFYLLYSCDNLACDPSTISTTFSENRAINLSFDTSFQEILYHIQDGDKLVFQYKYTSGHCRGYADDVYTLTLGFELPGNSTAFVLKDSALVEADCFVHHTSTWFNNYYPITSGTIEGQKGENDEWIVHGSVKYTIPVRYKKVKTISFDEVFR